MAASRQLKGYRQTIEEAVTGLGRDDVGVGDVVESGAGMLRVTFSRGTHTSVVEIAADRLSDKQQAKQAVTSALLALTKDVAQEAIAKA